MSYVKIATVSDTESSSDDELPAAELQPSTSQTPCIPTTFNNTQRTLAKVKSVRIDHSHDVNVGDTFIQQVISNGDVVQDIPLPQYLWKVMKSTTRFERISCAVVSLLVVFSIAILLYYFLVVAQPDRDQDPAPAEWYITRQMWLAKDWNETKATIDFAPIKLVIVQHSVSRVCYNFIDCASNLRTLQDTFMKNHNEDVPYNFLIGNEGRVYEGRGWGKVGDHSLRFNPCSVSIGFIGDYRYISATEQQLNRTRLLLAKGVKEGFLHPNYVLVGAKDIRDSESPGTLLYDAIRKLAHYDHENRYRDMICEQIYAPSGFEFRDDEAPWFISRKLWDAKTFNGTNSTARYEPLRLVVINQSESRVCYSYAVCTIELQNLQNWFFLLDQDIYYNFVIGNDGRVYEARGWGLDGGLKHPQYRPCALNIGFVGDYSIQSQFQTRVTEAQLNTTQMLLAQGVAEGHLHPDYVIVGAKDLIMNSTSPGYYLYNAIKQWKRYESDFRYRNLTCDQIHSLP